MWQRVDREEQFMWNGRLCTCCTGLHFAGIITSTASGHNKFDADRLQSMFDGNLKHLFKMAAINETFTLILK